MPRSLDLYAYTRGDPIRLRDSLGLWVIGDPIPDLWFNYSVGVADGLSFGAGRAVRSLTKYADDVCTSSTAYKAGVLSGIGGQTAVVAGGYAILFAGKTFAQSLFLSARLAVAAGDLTGATAAESEIIESLYTVGDLVSDSVIEAEQAAIRAASTLRSTTPAIW